MTWEADTNSGKDRRGKVDPDEQRVPEAGPPAEHDDAYPAEIDGERSEPSGEGRDKPGPKSDD